MLKRTLPLLLAIAVLGSVAALPGASARAERVAPRVTCPPGSTSSPYCERCVVPDVVGDSIRGANRALNAADCRLGLIYLRLTAKRKKRVDIRTSKYRLYTVVAQTPRPRKTEVAGYRVTIVVTLTG